MSSPRGGKSGSPEKRCDRCHRRAHGAGPCPIRLDFRHCRAQTLAYRNFRPGRRITNAWGRGVGKSWFARIMMWILVSQWEYKVRTNEELGQQYRGVRIALVYPTLAHFKRVEMAKWILHDLGPSGPWAFLGGKINQTSWKITFPGGSEIQVVSAEHADGYRGLRCDVVIADEADDIDIAVFEAVLIPWFTEPVSLNMVLITGTPKRGRFGLLWRGYHTWVHGDAAHPKLEGAFSTLATGYDCPAIVDVKKLDVERVHMDRARFEREFLCNFDSGEGLVYPFFDMDFHVRAVPPGEIFDEFIVGFDYGFSEPSAFVVIGIKGKGKDARAHVIREEYVYQKSDTELAAIAMDIDRSFPDAKWWCDHHLSTIAEFKRAGLRRVYEAIKGPGSVENGVSFVADAIHKRLFCRIDENGVEQFVEKAQFYVDPSCQHVIEEFGLYKRKRDPRNADVVLDNIDTSKNDHAMDAIRYALCGRFMGEDNRIGVNDLAA